MSKKKKDVEVPVQEIEITEKLNDETKTEETLPLAEKLKTVWETLELTDKIFQVDQLILQALKGLRENNPTFWIWVPAGTTEEFTHLWKSEMSNRVSDQSVHDPEHPKYKFIYPEIKEHENVQLPSLFTPKVQRTHELREYFHSVFRQAEPEGNPNEDTLAAIRKFESMMPKDPHDVLLGFYLAAEILIPTFLFRLEQSNVLINPERLEEVKAVLAGSVKEEPSPEKAENSNG